MRRNLYIDNTTQDLVINQAYNLKFTSTYGEWLSQKLEARLKTFLGEWFINQEIGIPYFQRILKKQVDLNDVNTLLQNYIKDTTGVEEILKFETDYAGTDRTYIIEFEVRATSGEIVEGSITI